MELFADYFEWRRHEAGVGECHPDKSVGVPGIPGFQDSQKTTLAPPIRLDSLHMGVEKSTPKRSHRVDGTPIGVGQEGASTIEPPRRYESGNADHLPLVQDQGARRGQQMLTSPGNQVLVRRQVLPNTFQETGIR